MVNAVALLGSFRATRYEKTEGVEEPLELASQIASLQTLRILRRIAQP